MRMCVPCLEAALIATVTRKSRVSPPTVPRATRWSARWRLGWIEEWGQPVSDPLAAPPLGGDA